MELILKKRILVAFHILAPMIFIENSALASTYFFAEAITWQVRESNATNWAQELTPSAANETIQFFEVPFKYSPGLRVGAGFQNDCSFWEIEAYYTDYQSQGRNQAHSDSGELHSAFSSNFYANNPAGNGVSGPYYHQASIQWDVDYSTFDLLLGRTITLDQRLLLRPFWGVKMAHIYQMMFSQWQDPSGPFSTATEMITNRFKGIGPSLGLDTTWCLLQTKRNSLALIANISGAFLSGSWTFSDEYQNNFPQNIVTQSDSLSSLASMVQAFLGIEWSRDIFKTQWSVRLGYEEQAWFNQLQYYSFDMGKTNDTLYLQGGVLDINIHF
jgi:hypothetical protein